jgi:hypothetical protein
MFFGRFVLPKRSKPTTWVCPPPAPPTKRAVLLTASRHGDEIVLCDDGQEVRRMTHRQACYLIARLASAMKDGHAD